MSDTIPVIAANGSIVSGGTVRSFMAFILIWSTLPGTKLSLVCTERWFALAGGVRQSAVVLLSVA